MTQLTNKQIEAQRVKFEKKYPPSLHLRWSEKGQKYHANFYLYDESCNRQNVLFDCWLSAIESNEIELPKSHFIIDADEDAYFANDLITFIEKQGFKVKV